MSLRRSPRGLPSPEVRELRASAMVRQMRKQAGSQKKHAASHADDVHASHGYSVNDADSLFIYLSIYIFIYLTTTQGNIVEDEFKKKGQQRSQGY